jgi:DNA-binding NarL/FixJ family response regulator
MTTIVLADDHAIIRQGLRGLLETEADFQVVAEAGDGPSAIQAVDMHKPDVIILDISMPGLNGLDVAQRISKHHPDTRVIILSMHTNESFVLKAIRNGASGYVLKASSSDDLVVAIHKVMAGDVYFSAPISQRALALYVEKARSQTADDPYESLTDREREVLQLSAEGFTAAEIAEKLFLSSRTVEMHRSNLMAKLDLRNQSELIRYAFTQGILQVD